MGSGIATPASIGVLQYRILEPKRLQDARQGTREAGFFRAISADLGIRKMLVDFAQAALQLLNHTLTRDVPEITLPIGRVYKLDMPVWTLGGHEGLERLVGFGRIGTGEIPGLRLDFKIQLPVRMLVESVQHELRERWRVMAIDAAMVAIGKPGFLRHHSQWPRQEACHHQ